MLWLPPVREDVVNVAVEPERVPVPRVVAPSSNVTVPVAPAVTVAVKVTESPKFDGFAELLRLVDDVALLTVWVRFEEVLPLKFESPL